MPIKLLIVTDAWHPQINGVVRTLSFTAHELERRGHDVRIIGPDPRGLFSFPLPGYPEITLEFLAIRRLRGAMNDFKPDCVHIATEGPLGWSMRRLCLRRGIRFTTSYQTQFPLYLAMRAPRGLRKALYNLTYSAIRHFHKPASAVMVTTTSMEEELRRRRFQRLALWSRGIDTTLFIPYEKDFAPYADLPRPISLFVGRVAVEKNLPAFLDLKTPGSKVVIGNGPAWTYLRAKYPDVRFLSIMEGEELARAYAAADLFVFPSKSDTFGLVLLEACAAGLRIAAYPVPGPADIFTGAEARQFAVLDEDLQRAVERALILPDEPGIPRSFAEKFSWAACTSQFYKNLNAGRI